MIAAAMLGGVLALATPAPDSLVLANAAARAAGNRREEAIVIGRALLVRTWPAQVLRIHVDAAGSHAVAGLELSGVKFHQPLDAAGFAAEVAALVRQTFDASDVQEVDVWATVPLAVGRGAVVAGDFAQPTKRIVFSFTARRSEGRAWTARLQRGEGVYWAGDWKTGLFR